MSDISDLTDKVKLNEWLNGMYSKGISTQKSELKTLFTKISDTSLTEDQKTNLTQNKETLKATVEKLEAEMAILEEEMAKSQEEIDKATKEITELLSDIKSKTKTIEDDQKQEAKNVVESVLARRKKEGSKYGVNEMVADMYKGIQKFADSTEYKSLQEKIETLTSKESKIKSLVESASSFIDRKNALELRYGVTKSTYDLITANVNAVEIKDASFTNVDNSVDKPIFSATKLETLVPYFDNTAVNVPAGENANYQEGTKAPNPKLDTINEKYKAYLKTEKTPNIDDSYSIQNEAVQNLGKAINEGLLTDLKMAGITGKDLVNFLTENFAGANIKKDADGKLKIPYGHGAQAREIFAPLTDFVKSQSLGDDTSAWSSDYFKGVQNTWDKNKGNTISTNNQIKSLNENFGTIAASMVASGFTFKEAMYAMFNPENGLFKDSGIIYDVSKQADGLKYFMEYAGDDETAGAYKNVAEIIYKNWGVKPTMCIDYDNIGAENPHGGENTPAEEYDGTDPIRTDPLGFVDGDTEYTFVVDRDTDGRFDGKNEFLGGDGSKSWLDDLKALDTDGNGILEGDELKNLKILKSKIGDNAQKTADGNAVSETTTIGYEFTNAKDLGIEKIDLNGLDQKVNQKAGRTDVNNSEVFNDSFSFTLNGKEITAKRKDDTDEYMNTVYGNTFGARLDNKSGLTEEEIDGVIEKDYAEFDKFGNKFKDYDNNVNVLNAFDNIINETDAYVKKAENESDSEFRATVIKGQNKAQSLYGRNGSWEDIRADVLAEAERRGISTGSGDFIQQAEGIYIMDGSLSAEGIVNKYIEITDAINSSETRRQNADVALSAMVACANAGIQTNLDNIFKLIEEGTATTADAILEYFKNQQVQPEQNS